MRPATPTEQTSIKKRHRCLAFVGVIVSNLSCGADATTTTNPKKTNLEQTTMSNFRAECDRRRAAGLALFNAYGIKAAIKAAGGTYDGRFAAWLLPNMDAILQVTAGRIERDHATNNVTGNTINAFRYTRTASGRVPAVVVADDPAGDASPPSSSPTTPPTSR